MRRPCPRGFARFQPLSSLDHPRRRPMSRKIRRCCHRDCFQIQSRCHRSCIRHDLWRRCCSCRADDRIAAHHCDYVVLRHLFCAGVKQLPERGLCERSVRREGNSGETHDAKASEYDLHGDLLKLKQRNRRLDSRSPWRDSVIRNAKPACCLYAACPPVNAAIPHWPDHRSAEARTKRPAGAKSTAPWGWWPHCSYTSGLLCSITGNLSPGNHSIDACQRAYSSPTGQCSCIE